MRKTRKYTAELRQEAINFALRAPSCGNIPIALQNALFAFFSVLYAMGFPKGRTAILPLGDRAHILCIGLKTGYTARLTHQRSHLEVRAVYNARDNARRMCACKYAQMHT
jgi:hypothetical protein